MQEWAWLISLIGSMAAVGAAIAAWRSASETKKAALAEILMQITDAYGSEEMLTGRAILSRWQTNHPTDFAEKFAQMRKNEYPKIEQEDKARRRYSHHFHKIWLLSDTKLVNKSFVKKVAPHGQVVFLLEIIEPLEKAMNPSYDRADFDFFRGLYS